MNRTSASEAFTFAPALHALRCLRYNPCRCLPPLLRNVSERSRVLHWHYTISLVWQPIPWFSSTFPWFDNQLHGFPRHFLGLQTNSSPRAAPVFHAPHAKYSFATVGNCSPCREPLTLVCTSTQRSTLTSLNVERWPSGGLMRHHSNTIARVSTCAISHYLPLMDAALTDLPRKVQCIEHASMLRSMY